MESFYATGKRKTAVTRVWLYPGNGKINVNNKSLDEYFGGLEEAKLIVIKALNVVDVRDKLDVKATASGGGVMAQAEALRHGISKALVEYNHSFRQSLKPLGFLSRDSRVKERKKYGHKKARKSFQWSKR